MAKRVRGGRSTHRPGGQGPSRSRRASEGAEPALEDAYAATSADDMLEDVIYSEVGVDEEAAAAVAAATSSARATDAAPAGPRHARRRDRRRTKQRPNDLAARAAAEDVWVREDLRRIGLVTVVLLVSLAVAWIVFGFLDVLSLY